MRKLIMVALVLSFFCSVTAPAWAGGGKVRGDSGQGAVNQVDFNSQGNQG